MKERGSDKKNLLVSFSGGETSSFMAKWLIDNKSDSYNFKFVFANTGEENEETLIFVDKCDKEWGLNVVWVEAVVYLGQRKGTGYKIVDFKTASRKGEPFEDVIAKYGIPNQSYPHCNRELKLAPIHGYIKSIGWKDYETAIGIRSDEIDRVSHNRGFYNLVYPLVEDVSMTKNKVNRFWSEQSFRLNLKGYQGNCKTCWKKSKNKLLQIAKETPTYFEFFKSMEDKYEMFTPEKRRLNIDEDGNQTPVRFFREYMSSEDIVELSKGFDKVVVDANKNTSYQIDLMELIEESESCDIYSNCGDL